MSDFLGFESFLVPLGASIEETKNTIKAAFTSRTWRLISESIQITSLIGTWTNNANAFDGDPGTTAYTAAALPQSIGLQIAGGFTPTKLILHGDTGNITYNPKDFSLDYSDNGTAWTPLQSWAGVVWNTNYEKKILAVAGATSHAYWRLTVTARNGGATLAVGNFILEDVSGRRTSNGSYYIDVIPPVTEAIGGNGAFEFIHIKFTANTIGLSPMKHWTVGFAQQVYMNQLTAGAVTVSCTLNGSTVSYTGSAGNTAVDNLLGLYGAIRDSVDSNFTAWNWEVSYPAPQNGDDANTYIFGINKTIEANKTFSVSNVTGGILSNYVEPGFYLDETIAPVAQTVTTDLVNGFIYYLQINARGTAIATKTNAGFYGPLHACYGDNAAAMAYLPKDNQFVSPMELVIGYDDASDNTDSWGIPATDWRITKTIVALGEYRSNYNFLPPGKGGRRHRFTEGIANMFTIGNGNNYRGFSFTQLKGSGIFVDNPVVGNDFQVHRVKTIAHTGFAQGSNPEVPSYSYRFYPGFELSDWYKFLGTANDEALTLIADTVGATTLFSNYTPGDNVLNLTDGSKVQSSGFVIIGTEALQYTGKSGNQLTGVTGAKYATLASRHYVGDSVGQGMWFVKINGGVLFAGYNKPS